MQLPIEVVRAVDKKALEYKLPSAHVAAIVEVESAGKIFAVVGGKQLPMVLFEPHLLYRRISGAARAEAVSLNLASAKWNEKLYPKTQAGRWAQIEEAQRLLARHGLNKGIAMECASYGVGQVLGSHWNSLGFPSLAEFMKTMLSGAEGQIDIMLRYCVVNGLDDELRDGRWAAFARGYNGPSFAVNQYDLKMADAAVRYGGAAAAEPDGMLRMGSKGARVREMQALLVRAGHQVKVDGDFGPATKKALKAFQKAHGFDVDGVYGPETEGGLGEYRQGQGDKPGAQAPTEVKGVVEGIGGAAGSIAVKEAIDAAKDSVDQAIPQLQQYEALSQFVSYGITALTVAATCLAIAGVGWAAWSFIQSRKTVEV